MGEHTDVQTCVREWSPFVEHFLQIFAKDKSGRCLRGIKEFMIESLCKIFSSVVRVIGITDGYQTVG